MGLSLASRRHRSTDGDLEHPFHNIHALRLRLLVDACHSLEQPTERDDQTVRLYSSLRQWNKKREDMTAKARDNHDLTFSIVIVVVVFVICQLANPIRRLLDAIYPNTENVCGSSTSITRAGCAS
ncbi:hypothetical protein LSH36_492g03036 [Paralvinella palmiformis]|uniref:Uncharacterized protein n=1 Tax=Paralvinella palmiformis TaxID=53620 RepID=A0AAD9MY59_9ANNE|nr:hypothetical protein LSH36_492g03036 [Paralvinella palmiformis]